MKYLILPSLYRYWLNNMTVDIHINANDNIDNKLKTVTISRLLGKKGKSVTIVVKECFVLSEWIDIAREK